MVEWLMDGLSGIGRWLIGLLIVGAVCLVAYPVSRIGWHLRVFAQLKHRRYRGEQLRTSARYAVSGIVLTIALGAVLAFVGPLHWWVSYAIGVALLIALGCFGYKLVPDG